MVFVDKQGNLIKIFWFISGKISTLTVADKKQRKSQ